MMHPLKPDLTDLAFRLRARQRQLLDRWRDDTRGTSMITTAITLPLLIILMLGIFYTYRMMLVKWSFDRGVRESARYLGEDAAFWERRFEGAGNLVDEAGMDLGVPPANYYDIEAKRIVLSRLRDVFTEKMVYDILTHTLQVTVTEPILSELVESGQVNLGATDQLSVTQGADMDEICKLPRKYNQNELNENKWRAAENIRFRIYATMDMPLPWNGILPFTDNYTVTMKFASRAVGYVQCARWSGQRDAANTDKTWLYSREGPALRYRVMATPGFPTVTPFPSPMATITPTMTPVGP
ncbi:MAG: pilus assembly protein [Caldilineae bacterium]|nr:pilus assembly protein [Chloroflexota bacterium]MCB9176477.1 pilus assembly protein [Caldilineae bacterium]